MEVSTDEVVLEPPPQLRSQRARHAPSDRLGEQRMSRPVGLATAALVVLQIAAVVVFATITILRYPLWSAVDEGAHFDNIVYIAEHGSYPVLGKALASEQELAIGQGVYPKHTTINPRTFGLGGLTYEAFQPPLYYYVATPVFFLSGNYHTKAILLRFFGLLLLVASIVLFARLSRHVLKKRWLLGLSGGLLVFLMPGVVVRMVTISDVNLAVPLAILTVTELWIAWQHRSSRRLVLCGFLVGCSALTDLYLTELIPVFVLVAISVLRRNRRVEDGLAAVSGLVIAGLVVLPWLIFNEVKYHRHRHRHRQAGAAGDRQSTPPPRHHRSVSRADGAESLPGGAAAGVGGPPHGSRHRQLPGHDRPGPSHPGGHRLGRRPRPASRVHRLLDPHPPLGVQHRGLPVHRHRTAVAVGLHGRPVHLPHTLPGGTFHRGVDPHPLPCDETAPGGRYPVNSSTGRRMGCPGPDHSAYSMNPPIRHRIRHRRRPVLP